MKKIILSIITILFFNNTNAQNEIDALRYSTNNMIGSARYSAMGGAFGSLGGEFSSLSSNPAGLGMYQSSEFTFSPNFDLNNRTTYFNNKSSEYNSAISIGSLGLVSSIPQKDPNWKRINFAIGWNQLAKYNNSTKIEGSSNNSIVNDFIDISNGTSVENLLNSYSIMAWETYLMNPDPQNNNQYISNLSNNTKRQSKSIEQNGSMNEFILSAASTYQDKLYIGATIGINTLNYYEYSEYYEEELDTTNNLRGLLFSEEISNYGTGFNIKLGAIYRISEDLKFGISVHSPKFLNIKEDYNTAITSYFKDSTLHYSIGYYTPFEYYLMTPLKSSISASKLFNNSISGFKLPLLLSAELEMIDYSTSEYLTSDFEDENETISRIYQNTANIKIGAELRVNPIILRTGYARYGSPFVNSIDIASENYCFGLGIDHQVYFFDVSYILSESTTEHILSNNNIIPVIDTKHSMRFTLGLRF